MQQLTKYGYLVKPKWNMISKAIYKVKLIFSILLISQLCINCDNGENTVINDPNILEFTAEDYVLLQQGNIPLIISVPHGGMEKPTVIPDRSCNDAISIMDEFTIELSEEIMQAFAKQGLKPYLIVNQLHRTKMDANRNRTEATCGNTLAGEVWDIFHNEIQRSKESVIAKFGRGLLLDLHGHGNTKQRVELGYLLYEDELARSAAELNSEALINVSSLKNLARNNLTNTAHNNLLRGEGAFGSLLDKAGFNAVPSANDPAPLPSDNYFSGGYITATHSSYARGTIDGIQVECNTLGLRDSPQNRKEFAAVFTMASTTYLETFYFNELPTD